VTERSELETAAATWREWSSRGEFEAGAEAMQRALDAPGADAPSVARVRVLYAAGIFAFRLGDQERSTALNEEALALARELGDVQGECEALTGLARAALRDGDYNRVVELAAGARVLAQRADDRAAEAAPLHLHAAGVRLGGDYEGARRLYLESLELNAELGNGPWQAMELHNLGWVELHRGDRDAAAARFAEREARGVGDDAYGEAWQELNRAALAVARGERDEARALFEAGTAKLSALGAVLDPDDRFEYDWLREQLAG
jgi:tetratricopeptide (TPR) repeat protein